jgi:iron complex outermembrane receptor protein
LGLSFLVGFSAPVTSGAEEPYAEAAAPGTEAVPFAAAATFPASVSNFTAPVVESEDQEIGGYSGFDGNLDTLFAPSLRDQTNLSLDSVSKYGQMARWSPANVHVITRSEITRFKYRSLPEALQSVTGFYVYNDTLYDFVNVRGMGLPGDFNTRVLVLLNGHTLNVSAGSGGANLHDFNIDMQSVERIEVIKGPGSVMYGTGAFFSVINIVTTRGHDANYVSATGGFPGNIGEGAASNFGRAGDWWWRATGRAYRDHGMERYFEVFDETQADADERALNGGVTRKDRDQGGGAYTQLGWQNFTLSAYAASRNKQEPTAQFETVFDHRENVAEDQRYFAELAYAKNFPKASVDARVYADYGNWQDYLQYEDGLYRDMINDRKGGGEVRSVFRLGDHRLLIGAEGNRHSVAMPSNYLADFRAENALGDRFWFSSVNVFAQNDWRIFDRIAIIGGLQVSTHTLYQPYYSPRAGLIVLPTENQTVKFLYSTGIRQPTSFERFFADNNAFIANDRLRPEYIQSAEVVYEVFPTERIRLQGAGFMTSYRDVIAATLVEVGGDPEDLRNQFVNAGSVRSRGIELMTEFQLSDYRVQAGGTYQEAFEVRSGLVPDASPHWLGNILLSGPLGESLTGAFDAHYVGSRRLMDDSDAVNPYWLLNATLSTRRFYNSVEFSVRGRNLLDHKYEELVSTDHAPLTALEQRPLTGYARVDWYY